MTSARGHVDDSQLRLLVFGDEDTAAYRTTSQHVESCQPCQARLDRLSGTDEFDAQARDMLDGSYAAGSSANLGEFPADTTRDIDYLSPATHPEMLGRLGRYEVERVLGRGGMGIVFKGFDTELNRPVALKVLARHLAHSGAARQRFAREAKAAAAIVHEHVVAIHNVESVGDTLFLVMPYVAGESLQARVEREGGLDAKQILRIGIQAAAGLQAAHDQGVVHRDIKPANILLEGGVERALVTDFGLAQTVDDATLTQTGIVTGTPNYMSPEQANGQPTDPPSDLFSLGCVLYFMATGRPPFRADKAVGVLHRICHEPHTPVYRVRPEIPDELSDVVDRLLAKKPSQRFTSASDLRMALQRALARLQHPRPRHFVAAKRFCRRNSGRLRTAAWVSAIGLLIAMAAVPLALTPPSKQSSTAPLLPSQPPRQIEFSVETWHQASPEEATEWAISVQETHESLRQLEHDGTDTPPSSQWNREIDRLQQQLNQFQSNAVAR